MKSANVRRLHAQGDGRHRQRKCGAETREVSFHAQRSLCFAYLAYLRDCARQHVLRPSPSPFPRPQVLVLNRAKSALGRRWGRLLSSAISTHAIPGLAN